MHTSRLLLLAAMTALPMIALLGRRPTQASQPSLIEAIAFASTRDYPTGVPGSGTLRERTFNAAEIYLMNPDGTNQRRLTNNVAGDGLPALAPDGRLIVFDSNRLRTSTEPVNTSDLFVMNVDGTEQRRLTRGSSATWSPHGKLIAFHASRSGTLGPIKNDPGAATFDSDIFVMSVTDCLALIKVTKQDPAIGDCRQVSAAQCNLLTDGADRVECNKLVPVLAKNLTHDPAAPAAVHDDPDWSPDGTKIVYTSHSFTDNHENSVTAEIYVINADGSGPPTRLTFNTEEERAPDWSKQDGSRIVYSCRKGSNGTFELCIMNADGTGQVRLTFNTVPDLSSSWSLDDQQIAFGRQVELGRQQIFVMNPVADPTNTGATQLTTSAGTNLFPSWGVVRVKAP